MFSIEQSGFSIKASTIDELLIEYIKKYACMCHNGSNGSNITGPNQEQIKELITSTVGEHLEKYALAKDLESYALQTQLFDYVKTEDFNTEMLKYASSEDVDGAIGELRDYIAKNCALSTEIPEVPENIVTSDSLSTALEPYAKTQDLPDMSEYVKTQDLPDMTKYALTTDIPKEYFTDSSGEVYIKDPNNILTLGGANQTCSDAPLMVMKPNHSRNTRIFSIGNQLDSSKERWLDFDIDANSPRRTVFPFNI